MPLSVMPTMLYFRLKLDSSDRVSGSVLLSVAGDGYNAIRRYYTSLRNLNSNRYPDPNQNLNPDPTLRNYPDVVAEDGE